MSVIYYGNRDDTTDRVSNRPIEINSCGVRRDRDFCTVREKGRSDFLLIFVDEGVLEMRENDGIFDLCEGQIALIRPHFPHYYTQKSGTYYYLHFSGSAIDQLLFAVENKPFLTLELSNKQAFKTLIERLLFDFETCPKHSLCPPADLLHIFDALQNQSTAKFDDRLKDVLLYIQKNYAKPIEIKELANIANLSEGRFIKVFKKATGQTPHAYILDLRLFFAKELLINTDMTIYQIASTVGFDDAFYFSRLFKSRFKSCAREFRSNQRRI